MTLFVPIHVLGVAITPPWIALALLGLLALVEAGWLRATRRRWDAGDAAANVAMYAVNVGVLFVWTPLLFFLYDAVHQRALLELGWDSPSYARAPWLVWLLLIVAEDLCFYVFHRASHRSRLLWASHENHHSSTSFNWTVALRQTWTPFLAALFWLPLPLLGFEPLMVLAVQTGSLIYQSFQHTELGGTFGPLGWIFNTPGHHRVHHGADEECLDRNYGGVLIVWDRLFGTFTSRVPTRYGLADERRGNNPLVIAFAEWLALARALVRSRSVSELFGRLLRAPGWQPGPSKKGI